jgi:hypothetical protein
MQKREAIKKTNNATIVIREFATKILIKNTTHVAMLTLEMRLRAVTFLKINGSVLSTELKIILSSFKI